MTPAEVDDALARLASSFPDARWDDETLLAYDDGIADLDASAVLAAVRQVARESDARPTIARLRGLAQAEMVRSGVAEPAGPAVDPDDRSVWRAPPETAGRLLRSWREALERSANGATPDPRARPGSDGHWHGGPEPCGRVSADGGVCGGVVPPGTRPPRERRPAGAPAVPPSREVTGPPTAVSYAEATGDDSCPVYPLGKGKGRR